MKIRKTAGGKTLTLTRSDWLSIGRKAGWTRVITAASGDASSSTGPVIRIDGKDYKEEDLVTLDGRPFQIMDIRQRSDGTWEAEVFDNDGNTRTVQNDPKSVTVNIGKESVTFHEGGAGTNYFGEYSILALNEVERTMDVVFTDGTRKTFSIPTQAQITLNEASRMRQQMGVRKLNLKSPDESFTLGFLAANGVVQVMIGHENADGFATWYKKVTGDDFQQHLNNQAWIRYNENTDYLRVAFPMPDQAALSHMSLVDGQVVPIYTSKEVAAFNSHNFIRNLFMVGFRIGRNNDQSSVARIRKNVADKDSFDKGLAFESKGGSGSRQPAISADELSQAPLQPTAAHNARLTIHTGTITGKTKTWFIA